MVGNRIYKRPDSAVMGVIADASVVYELLFGKQNGEYQKLKEMITDGKITLRIPDTVRYEIFETIIKKRVEPKYLQRLLSLITQFLECVTVEMNVDQLSKAAELCKKLEVNLSSAACLILATTFGELYVTADTSVADKLKKNGYPVLHIKELFSI